MSYAAYLRLRYTLQIKAGRRATIFSKITVEAVSSDFKNPRSDEEEKLYFIIGLLHYIVGFFVLVFRSEFHYLTAQSDS